MQREYLYKSGEEVQVRDSGLWQIGSFIQENENGTLRVRIGRKEVVDARRYDVKPNLPAYQKEDGFAAAKRCN